MFGWESINQVDWFHETIAKPTEQQLITIHDNFELETQNNIQSFTKINDIDTVRSLLRSRVLKELIAETINTTTLKNDLQTIINSNPQALTAFNRTATLWAIDTTTVLGYIRVCYLLTAIAD